MELSHDQEKAVKSPSNKTLVIAPAGSGKTRVLTERIAYLVEGNTSPYEIMAFSFTRKSSNEIKERLETRIGNAAFKLTMGTMHSIGLQMIRRFGHSLGIKPKTVTAYGSFEEDFLLKECAMSLGLHTGKTWKKIKKRDITELFDDYYQRGVEPSPDHPAFDLFREFMQRCRENNSLTYGGLLIGLRVLIPIMAKNLHIKHILVDEVQDIDPLQWTIINEMVEAFGASLFVVGDIDQSIYSFRGAVPEYLIEHQNEFDIYRLEKNYRSCAEIVEPANSLIKHNVNRIDNKMVATREDNGTVTILKNMDSTELAKMISFMPDETKKDTAVLSRNHILLKKLSGLLDEMDIKNTYIGKNSELTRSENFRRFHAFLKLVINPYDNFSFLMIKNTIDLDESQYKKIRLKAVIEGKSHFQVWENMKFGENFQTSAWQRFFNPEYNDVSLIDYIGALNGMTQLRFSNSAEFVLTWIKDNPEGTIQQYLDWLTVYDLQDEITEENEGVQLMTIHASKGLEFPVVIIAGMNEGLLPSKQSIANGDVEDERRVGYTAMTRAENQLILTVRPEHKQSENGTIYENPISRFVGEAGL